MLGSRTRKARKGLTASILVVGLAIPVTVASASNAQTAAAPAVYAAAGPTVTRLADTELDPRALYFVSYDGLVNNASYQQEGILTFDGYRYTAWYTASRRVVVARRQLPSGDGRHCSCPTRCRPTTRTTPSRSGCRRRTGGLHVAMDTHDSRVFYVKSEAGLLTDAGSRSWAATAFGPVQRTLDGLELGAITYPQFAITPERRLRGDVLIHPQLRAGPRSRPSCASFGPCRPLRGA